MCRFVAYSGKPLLLDQLVSKPKNSLIRQSHKATETREPLNADGFGIGWYDHSVDSFPAIFNSIQPAWNDLNLLNLVEKIRSTCFFAHVRAASMGGVTKNNCHPFRYNDLMFMHNGLISGFHGIKRQLRQMLSDETYLWLTGQTDSETLFALFADAMSANNHDDPKKNITKSLISTINTVIDLQKSTQPTELSLMNIAITDGKNLVASRYSSHPEKETNSLYYSRGSELQYHDGITEMLHKEGEHHAVIIASEKLTRDESDWEEVPVNHILIVDEAYNIELIPIES